MKHQKCPEIANILVCLQKWMKKTLQKWLPAFMTAVC